MSDLCVNQVYAWIWIKDLITFTLFVIIMSKTEDIVKSAIFGLMVYLLMNVLTPIGIGMLRGVC